MDYLSFGKIAVKTDQIEGFLQEGQSKGLSLRHVRANIYEMGMTLPNMLDPAQMKKTAGMLGLKYSEE